MRQRAAPRPRGAPAAAECARLQWRRERHGTSRQACWGARRRAAPRCAAHLSTELVVAEAVVAEMAHHAGLQLPRRASLGHPALSGSRGRRHAGCIVSHVDRGAPAAAFAPPIQAPSTRRDPDSGSLLNRLSNENVQYDSSGPASETAGGAIQRCNYRRQCVRKQRKRERASETVTRASAQQLTRCVSPTSLVVQLEAGPIVNFVVFQRDVVLKHSVPEQRGCTRPYMSSEVTARRQAGAPLLDANLLWPSTCG